MAEMHGLPPAHRPTEGNLSAVVVVDRRRPHFGEVEPAILAALGHIGLPYAVRDLADGPLVRGEFSARPLVIVGQEGLGESLGEAGSAVLVEALSGGTGLVCFDPCPAGYSREFLCALQVSPRGEATATQLLRTATNAHWVSRTRVWGEEVEAKQPVRVFPMAAGGRALLVTGSAQTALSVGHHGRGRYAHWAVSPEVWLQSHLGHAGGLDDLFWKSLVWCARKPVVMNAMPPFVTARVDDACGVNSLWWVVQKQLTSDGGFAPPLIDLICDRTAGRRSAAFNFQYLDIYNQHGYLPSIGIYLDQVPETDWPKLKTKSDAGLVGLSAHAFADHKDNHGIDRCEFIYSAGPSCPGRHGEPWMQEDPPEVAREKFRRMDASWEQRGIRPARTLNSHWHNPSVTALPLLKERGINFLMLGSFCGLSQFEPESFAWRLAPYGKRGYFADYMPIPQGVEGAATGDFFTTQSYSKDFLWEVTVGMSERQSTDIGGAVQRILPQLRLGLDSLFYGCPMVHEQRISMLTAGEFDEILSEADRLTSHYEKQFVSYDHVSEYAKSKFDTHLTEATVDGAGRVSLRLAGRTTLPLQLQVFTDDGEDCVRRYHAVPAFEGSAELVL